MIFIYSLTHIFINFLFNKKLLISKNTMKEIRAFQPARDNPNISNITSSHLIVDLLRRYVSVSFEKLISDEHPSGPFQKLISIPKWYSPAKELESQIILAPNSISFFEIVVFFKIKIIIKL